MLQTGGVYTGIRPPEVLRLFASYYDDPADPDELLERVGLADRRRSTWRSHVGRRAAAPVAGPRPGRPAPRWPSSTSPPPASTPPGASSSAASSPTCAPTAWPCCSPPTTSTRPRSWPTGWSSSTTATCWPTPRPTELMAGGQGDELHFGAPGGLDVAALGARLGAPVTEESPGEYRVAAAAHPRHRRRPHRLAGRARPAPRRPAGRAPEPRGRVPPPHPHRRRGRRRAGRRAGHRGRGPTRPPLAVGGPADEGLRRPDPHRADAQPAQRRAAARQHRHPAAAARVLLAGRRAAAARRRADEPSTSSPPACSPSP